MCKPWPSIIMYSSAANTPLRESHVACHMAPIKCASHTIHLNQTLYLAENPSSREDRSPPGSQCNKELSKPPDPPEPQPRRQN